MEPWKIQLEQDYKSGELSEQGRKNYEADIASGVLKPDKQVQIIPGDQAGIEPAHAEETKPYLLPDDVLERFWSGKMSDEGMKNLIADARKGLVTAEPPKETSFLGSIKESITGEGRRVPETEKLNSWTYMPEMNNLSVPGVMSLVGTMAAGPDEIATTIKKQWPGVKVKQDSKGNYVFTSGIDGQQYSIKPGFRPEEDLLRSASTLMLYSVGAAKTVASFGAGALSKMAGAGASQFGIEASQEIAGGKFNSEEIPLAIAFEGGGQLLGKGAAALKGYLKSAPEAVKNVLGKAGIQIGQNVPTQLEQSVKTAESMGVKPMTSDVFPPQTFTQKTAQIIGERIPIVGTASERVTQQKAREQAVKRVLSDYGADEIARASDDVTKDLLQRRSDQLTKYTYWKKDVINRLSGKDGDRYKQASGTIEGLRVTENTPNLGSISSTFNDGEYTVLKGVREVNINDLGGQKSVFYAADDFKKARTLAKEIDKNKYIDPLIIAIDEEGPYILEGSHRYVALDMLGKKKFPAIIVREKGSKGFVPIVKAQQTIKDEITRLKALNNKEVEPIIRTLENAQESFSNKTLSQIEDNRKLLGETLDSEDFTKVRSQAQKVNRSLYKAVNEDMGEYIKANGQIRDFNKWKVANKRLEGMIGDLKKTSFKSVIKKGDATPEEVRKLLFSNKPSDISALYKDLTPEGKNRARVAIWQEALDKAGGIDNLSTAKFKTALNKLEKSTGVFFKGEDKTVLDGLIKTLDMTKRAEIAGVQTPTGMQNFQIIGAFGLGTLAGGAKGAAIAGTLGTAARVYESRPVRNLLIKIAKGKGNEAQYINKLVNTLRTYHQYNKPPVSASEQRRALELVGQEI